MSVNYDSLQRISPKAENQANYKIYEYPVLWSNSINQDVDINNQHKIKLTQALASK